MSNEILVKQDGSVLHVTINAPDRGNAVTDDMVRELTSVIGTAGDKADIVRSVVALGLSLWRQTKDTCHRSLSNDHAESGPRQTRGSETAAR